REPAVTRLEQRYRRVLRLLPAAYRAAWEEEMVAAFLESRDSDDAETAEYTADFGRPSWAEVASVAVLALRLRLEPLGLRLPGGAPPPRALAWGQAIRLFVLAGLLAHAVVATVALCSALWLAADLWWLPAPPADWPFGTPTSAWQAVMTTGGFLWLPAYVGVLLGHLGVARLLAAAAVLPEAASAIRAAADLIGGAAPFLLTTWCSLLLQVVLVLGLATLDPVAPSRRRLWLLAPLAGVASIAGLSLLARLGAGQWLLLDWPGVCCLALVGAALVHLAAPAVQRARAPAWTLALALLAAAVLGLRASSLLDWGLAVAGRQGLVVLAQGAAEALAVLAVGVPLVLLAQRELRRLPPLPATVGAAPPPTR
ncbi:MAG TPA: hypothetical protein VGC06_14805, partial [Actinomycetes bacterium]